MTDSVAPDRSQGTDPWERFGWLMGAIWIVFLVFPLEAALSTETTPVRRAAAVVLILAFGATYLRGLLRTSRMQDWSDVVRSGWAHLAVMVALQVASAVVIGIDAIFMMPFVISFATFTLPLRTALTMNAAGVLAVVVVLTVTGSWGEAGFFAPIVALVAISTGLIRVINQRQGEHHALTEDLALVAERERVARDVHDVIGHSLTVVSVKAELAERLVEADPARAKAELVEIQSLTREALAEIRATVAGLRVARLGDELTSARRALAGAGIDADLPDDPSVVDPRHRIVVAWVLREAVTNVIRHSGASRCTVELDSALLRVTDDGKGIDGLRAADGLPDGNGLHDGNGVRDGAGLRDGNDLHDGNGLRGVRERVAAAGGTLTLLPGPDGRGTTVEVRL